MGAASSVLAFGVVLALVSGGGWAVGRAVGPLPGAEHGSTAPAPPREAQQRDEGAAAPPGLAAAQNGYVLVTDTPTLRVGVGGDYRFRVTDASGATIDRFAVEHDKRLHLIVVRRDGAGYRHLHPEMAADGTWSVPLTMPAAGTYRVFADFRPEGGVPTTLGADLQVAGDFQPVVADHQNRTAEVAGYEVRLDGDLVAGTSSTVRAVVTSQGRPVTDLQPYLGAYGHLVALRGSDLAYLHVHPAGTPGDGRTPAGPEVTFAVEVPTTGRYLLFLDFQHAGLVHTAQFTLDAAAAVAGSPATTGAEHAEDTGHGG